MHRLIGRCDVTKSQRHMKNEKLAIAVSKTMRATQA